MMVMSLLRLGLKIYLGHSYYFSPGSITLSEASWHVINTPIERPRWWEIEASVNSRVLNLGSGINANSEFNKPRVPILISNKIYFKTKYIIRSKKCYHNNKSVNSLGHSNYKCSFIQYQIFKQPEAKVTKLMRKIDNSSIRFVDFNTLCSEIDITTRQKINKM